MLRDLGFFEALGAATEGNSEWLELSAGLLVLRFAETVLDGTPIDSGTAITTRRYVGRLRDFAARRRLTCILDALARLPDDSSSLFTRLYAYGMDLHERGFFAPAMEVFTLVCQAVGVETSFRLQAMHRRAFALRLLGRLDDAEATCAHMLIIAREAGDRRMALEAELGLCRTLIGRGDYPAAESAMRRILRVARQADLPDVLANALLDMSTIVGVRGRPGEGLRYANEALSLAQSAEIECRAMVNCATALRELGRSGMARSVAAEVARDARFADQRLAASMLLYQIAIDDGDQAKALEYRVQMEGRQPTPVLGAEYFECVAREHATFGRFADAEDAVRRMMTVAEHHGLNEIIIRADRAMADLRRGVVPAMYQFRPTPPAQGAPEQRMLRIERELLTRCSD